MGNALGEAATHLPWLCPSTATLSALARALTGVWETVRSDPAAVLLVVRQCGTALADPARAAFPTLVYHPAVLTGALSLLQSHEASRTPLPFVDWSASATRPVYTAALVSARLAHALAGRVGDCDPETAWVASLLAPLGWLAVSAAAPDLAAACLADPAHARHARATETRHWGLDAAALGRRLAQQWELPPWLAAVVGHLGLPVEIAERFGADPELFRIVQLAVGLAQQQGGSTLALPVRPASAESVAALGLSAEEVDLLVREALNTPPPPLSWESPVGVPLLPTVLALAAENRALRGVPTLAALQRDLDELHLALENQLASESERLHTQKLSALAEFAAGAGHEINNPLAVISGQAQYLLKKVTGAECVGATEEAAASCAMLAQRPALVTSLNTIIQQTRRIHQVLTELMQFARPSRPRKEAVDVLELVREVAASVQDSAARGQVQMVCSEDAEPLGLHADRQQLKTALACLVRNAVESAPEGGWARVQVKRADPEFVELVVEDSGPGPSPAQREHLFDPFFSGRHAGRGRGLGLPTAWRLAREHGGDVRFEGRPGGPTRFVLSLPRDSGTNGHEVLDHSQPASGAPE
jgi:signal transduction histidine kinase